MPLEDLNKELYGSHSDDIIKRGHEQSEYDPKLNISDKQSPFQDQENWTALQQGLSPKQKKKIWIAIAVFFVVLFAVGGALFYNWWMKNAFHQDRVSLSFEGPGEVDSTQLTKYSIKYVNNNRVTLKNAEIQLSYSENFQPTDNLNLKYLSPTSSKIFIGDIAPMKEGLAELTGVFYAPKDSPIYINGRIGFIPSNASGELFVENSLGVKIMASPVMLNVSAPKQVVSGDALEYVVDYSNLDVRSLGNVQVRIEFPQGFKLNDSLPKASENGSEKNNVWYIGNLEPKQGGKISIRGQINGSDGEGKNIIISLGYVGDSDKFIVYDKQEFLTKIVLPILTVSQKLEDKEDVVVHAGESLKYSITFQNTGDIGLRDAIVTVEVKGDILDFSKLSVEKGFYDSGKNLLIWKASDVPALANINPKAGGVVNFNIPIKSIIPIKSKIDKNFIISSIAKIDSPDIPTPIDSNKIIGSNNLELRLESKVLFDVTGFYNDLRIKNSGPIPMESGRETTFTIHWSIINISNDISGAKIISSLPTGVRWTGEINPTNEKISYNPRTNQLIWEGGDIIAGTGILAPAREVSFQVGVTPQINQVGEPVNLINKSVFSAKDLFVGRDIMLESDIKNTFLREDPTVGFVNGKVAK